MKQFFWIFSFLLLPIVGHAQVLISEVAWMGTDVSTSDEWIELYNNGSESVSLDGWSLVSGDGKLNINFGQNAENPNWDGVVNAGEYVLLERTNESTLPETSFFIYKGALVDTGMKLLLKDVTNTEIDNVDGSNGWKIDGAIVIGSNVVPRMTAQRTRTGVWVTGSSTPGIENVQEDALTTTEEETDTIAETITATTQTQTSSGGGGSKTVVPKKVVPVSDPVLSLSLTAPRIAYVNQEVTLEVEPQGIGKTFMNSLVYTWNFGDTYTTIGKKNTHIFEYPGEYIVIVEGEFAKQKAQARVEINVLPVSISMSRTEKGDVVIKNNSKQEVDLGGFALMGAGSFIFPKLTILKAGGVLTISAKRINVQKENSVALYDALHTLVVRDGGAPPLENILALKNPTTQRRVTAISEIAVKNKAPVAGGEGVQTSPSSTGTSEVKTEKTTFIPIGKFAARDESASQGFFQKIVSRVFGFFGM